MLCISGTAPQGPALHTHIAVILSTVAPCARARARAEGGSAMSASGHPGVRKRSPAAPRREVGAGSGSRWRSGSRSGSGSRSSPPPTVTRDGYAAQRVNGSARRTATNVSRGSRTATNVSPYPGIVSRYAGFIVHNDGCVAERRASEPPSVKFVRPSVKGSASSVKGSPSSVDGSASLSLGVSSWARCSLRWAGSSPSLSPGVSS
jgi:hypothetical protein